MIINSSNSYTIRVFSIEQNINIGDGIKGNSSFISVNSNTGIISNSSGIFVDSAYINTISSNNATYLNGNTADDLRNYSSSLAANAYTNAVAYVDSRPFVNTSQLSSNLTNYQTSAGLAANVATLTSNNSNFVGGNSAATLRSYSDTMSAAAYSNAITHSSNATNISSGTLDIARIASSSVTYAKIQNVSASNTVLGRVTSGAGVIEELTATNLRTLISLPTSSTAGRLAIFTDIAGTIGSTTGLYEDGSGNVGINKTSSLAATLDITGTLQTSNTITAGGLIKTKVLPGTAVFHHDASLNPDNGGYDWKLIYSGTARTDGPTSNPVDPIYTDDVWCWGIGMSQTPGVKAVSDKVYGAWHIESKFYGGTIGLGGLQTPFLEHFFTFIPINSTTNYRPIAFVGTHDGSYTNAGFNAHHITFQTLDALSRVEFDFRAANAIKIYNSLALEFQVNNSIVGRQLNAAGDSTVAFPYLNYNDNYECAAAFAGTTGGGITVTTGLGSLNTATLTVAAPCASASNIDINCGLTQSASSAFNVTANGTTTLTAAAGAVTRSDVGRTITGTNVPGSTTIASYVNSTTFTVNNACPNTVTSITMSARTKRSVIVGVDSAGSFILRASVSTTYFDFYNDIIYRNQASSFANQMHLYLGCLGVGVAYPSGPKIQTNGTIKAGPFTVSTLPAASTHVGAMAYVTDSSVTTFGSTVAGGGSNNVAVRSNGTNWTVAGI